VADLLLDVHVPYRPHPLQRARHTINRTYDTPANAAAKQMILWHTRWKRQPYEGPVRMTIECYFVNPARSGDVDNLAKTVLDAFNKVVIRDDRQVWSLKVAKYVGQQQDATVIRMWAEDPPPQPSRRSRGAGFQRSSKSSRRGRATSTVRRTAQRTASTPAGSGQSAQP
jgi:Holliday junction resolvase RusA-like endonuclease